MDNEVDARTHYDLLINEGNDPVHDDDRLQQYMCNWDGPLFYQCLGSLRDQSVLEIGVGTGRIAKQVLSMRCKTFTGIDISSKTIERAVENLKTFENVELIAAHAEEFVRIQTFDLIYSVLTFMHIQNKERAVKNILDSLKPGGFFVLSISKEDEDWFVYENRKVRLFPDHLEESVDLLTRTGFKIEFVGDTERGFATIIKARKPHS